ncbi:MAG: CDP-alcohol phosphatidyltransferase family protein [Candidatus Acidiferrales bacterium]
MTPNQVTAARVAAGFLAVAIFAMFGRWIWADLGALSLIVAAIALDALDGYLARTRNLATPLGAQFDILGDRIIENLFFTFFATAGLITLWVPVFFFARGTIIDFLRGAAAKAERSGFGENSMLETRWGRALVASRASRVAYAVIKCVCFCWLGIEWTIERSAAFVISDGAVFKSDAVGYLLVGATALFCLVRAIPVMWEGRRFLATLAPLPARALGVLR